VRITESVVPSGDVRPDWKTAIRPTVIVGDGSTPEQELTRVGGAFRFTDGSIVVSNRKPLELRVYDQFGKFIKRVGRAGSGPGEFRDIGSMQSLPGDSILTFDRSQRRISIFGPDGTHIRSATLSPSSMTGTLGLYSVLGAFTDGTFLAEGSGPGPARSEGIVTPAVRLARANAGLDSASAIGVFTGDDVLYERSANGGVRFWPPMFGRTTKYLLAGRGFYLAHNARYEIRRYSELGKLESLIRVIGESHPLSERDLDTVIDSIAERSAVNRDVVRREISHYQTSPAYGPVLLDAEGNIWAREYAAPGHDRPRWDVFGPDGGLLAIAETPRNAPVLSIGADYLIVLDRNVDGLERVLLYPLEKHAAARHE
jgi:hypothetical protein